MKAFKKKPDVTANVTIPSTSTAGEAARKYQRFIGLCSAHNVRVTKTVGSTVTLSGSKKNIEAFISAHSALSKAGLV